jgi:acyl carrier protein
MQPPAAGVPSMPEVAADMPTNHASERTAILAVLSEIFRSVLDDPDIEVTMETTCDDLPCWDPMNHITIVVEAEYRFDIQFRTAEIEDLTRVSELVRLIETKRAVAHVHALPG